ncbi:hypothetical protein F511_41998 [Dorcoceras hygrometricum]|uniref:Uncharacterized protein n=1 Tax=Dorcoceras hygrometricum TaxID=472368 RepID=A0A2Z7C1Z0_9LAMI|nr:hypothetical protein F511_41998 [Dorcoceras hygrometricum]
MKPDRREAGPIALRACPDNQLLSEFGAESLMSSLLPRWEGLLDDFDYKDPRYNPLLRPAAARTPSHTTAHQPIEPSLLDLLQNILSSREHCDVLSMQIDSDLVIYRTTLVRTFQVVTICRVDKSEVLVVLISPHDSKRH